MNFGEYQDGKPQQRLPASLVPYESEIDSFFTLCRKTCTRILTLLALGLEVFTPYPPLSHHIYIGRKTNADAKMDPTFFTKAHDPTTGPSGSILRYLYYPSMHASSTASYQHDGSDARAGAHSDYGSVTLLFQRMGESGLEIQLPGGDEWAGVPVCPGGDDSLKGEDPAGGGFPPVVVNIGDLLSYWTDGLLKSTMHRVVFGSGGGQHHEEDHNDRYSIVFFSHPANSIQLTPVPSAIVAAHRKAREDAGAELDGAGLEPGKSITASEHLKARLMATYGFA